ncbi:MAG: hypothetical protein LBN95_05990 [Prevotellaceae bacterium]|jgi:hypothetical protein|nr:hypothetical protein [Prevotellaceae bacterium]
MAGLYLNLNSRLTITDATIGKGVQFDHIAECEVRRSVVELGDTATITIPRRYGKIKDRGIFEYFKVGDKIKLELGYNGELFTEFTGYLREIESGYPVRLQCDDELYPLRKNSWNKSWQSIKLKQLLNVIVPGYKIECADVNLGKFQIDNASTIVVLQELKKQYGFSSFLKENTLYCQFTYDVRGVGDIKTYDFAKNVRKDKTSLKYRRKEDFKIQIKAISNNSNGKKTSVTVGSKEKEASVRTLNFKDKTEKELRELALKQLDALVFDGFEGTISGFGYPRVQAGDTLKIVNEKEPERNGSYLVEGVTIKYGNAYYERECKLSYKQTNTEEVK